MSHKSSLIAESIEAYLNAHQHKGLLRFMTCGSVDDGKSTLIGRLLYESKLIFSDQLAALEAESRKRNVPPGELDLSLLVDGLAAEREQGITIDVAYRFFSTDRRKFIVADSPGHEQYTRNMVTAASNVELAILLVDARKGVLTQTRRHSYLVSLLGIQKVVLAVNKMDAVDFSEEVFLAIAKDYLAFAQQIGLSDVLAIPLSALKGDNVTSLSARTPYFRGPTLMEYLETVTVEENLSHKPLRMPVQDVYKFDQRRIIAGRVESGRLKVGDEVIFSPSNKTATVKSIEAWHVPEEPESASAGQSIGVTLTEQIFVERGEVMSHLEHAPIESNVFKARLFWLGHNPLTIGRSYTLKLGTLEAPVTVEAIDHVIDTSDLSTKGSDKIERNGAGEVVLRTKRMLALDEHGQNPITGRFVLVEDYLPMGGGIVSMDGYPDQRQLITVRSTNITEVGHAVTREARSGRNGHKGAVLWFTGLSGAGKSTLAQQLERQLFALGCQVIYLDGDNVRHGLNGDLGFSAEDRKENIRRVAEVAKLTFENGLITLCAFISPYVAERQFARSLLPPGRFIEVYVQCDLEEAQRRDPKGLYARAERGEIRGFTGIDEPYEVPEAPEVTLDTMRGTPEENVEKLIQYLKAQGII